MATNALTFLRCRECETGVAGITTAIDIKHNADGTHTFIEPPAAISSQAGLASFRGGARPSHRTLSIWQDVRAALENIRTVEFYMGYLPEKPRGWDDDAVRMQLDDARAVLGELANALADGVQP